MEHQEAAPLLHEFALERITGETRERLARHVDSCAECREALGTIRAVREQVSEHGAALFGPHPAADELASYALASRELSTATLATTGSHVCACATCRAEVEVARRARTTAWQRSLPAWLASLPALSPAAVLRPALAVLAVLLIFPAYLGLVQYPRERAQAEHAAEALQHAQSDLRESAANQARKLDQVLGWGGGVQPLMLSSARRAALAASPSVTLRPGQPLIPILMDLELNASREQHFEIAIRREPGVAIAWRNEAAAGDLWDAQGQLVALLVPAAALAPGEYRLELRALNAPQPLISASFVVRGAAR